ncbi:flavoprotein [Micromonospora sp. NPDC050686]|uniref:flavoprotein n=1 Tax=Micromonospora sp. NPDC050686 TaxID=3154631 RepID=UPI00340758D6
MRLGGRAHPPPVDHGDAARAGTRRTGHAHPRRRPFAPARSFTLLTGHPALVDEEASTDVPHLALAAWADLVLVLPATANTLAKAVLGIADNLVSTCLLAAAAPVVLVPSMNRAMWERPAVQRNVAQLREDGYVVVPPVPVLALSTGTFEGRGMPPVEVVLESAAAVSRPRARRSRSAGRRTAAATGRRRSRPGTARRG